MKKGPFHAELSRVMLGNMEGGGGVTMTTDQ